MTAPAYFPPSSDDDAVALAVLDTFRGYIRYAVDTGSLLRFDNLRWYDWCTKAEARDFCASLTLEYKNVIPPAPPARKTETGLVHADTGEDLTPQESALVLIHRKLSSAAGQSSVATTMLRIARSKAPYHEYVADLDAEPHIFWAAGNPIHLTDSCDGPLVALPGTYNEVHKHSSPYVPDYDTSTRAWDAFLRAVWPDDQVRAYAVREIAGRALWGATSKQHPVLDGPPGTGKSTVIEQVVKLLGTYAVQISPEMLIGHNAQGSAGEEQKYRMLGARLVWMDEPPGKGKQALSQFKDLSSGTGTLSASRKYQNEVTAPRLYNFVVCQNKVNRLNMGEEGIAERLVLIPCTGDPSAIAAARQEMLDSFEAEAPGILATLITECAMFRNGYYVPEPFAVLEFRERLIAAANGVGEWLMENYEVLPPDTPNAQRPFTIGNLWASYNAFAKNNGEKTLDRADFRDALNKLGVNVSDTQGPGGKRNQVALKMVPMAQGAYR